MAPPYRGGWARQREMCNIYGSVIPRSLPYAFIGALQGALMEASVRMGWDIFGLEYQETWLHPYALHMLGMVLGFSLVMRIQIAYARFWEGATQIHQASSKWADAAMQVEGIASIPARALSDPDSCFSTLQVMAFDEASKNAFSEQARTSRAN